MCKCKGNLFIYLFIFSVLLISVSVLLFFNIQGGSQNLETRKRIQNCFLQNK